MRKLLNHIVFYVTTITVVFFLSSCGGNVSSNKYLGELPGIAKKYAQEIDGLKQDLKASTDINESFGLKKKIDNLEDEAEQGIKDYLTGNPLTKLPFEQKAKDKFTVKEVSVHPQYPSSINRLQLLAKVTINEDIRNDYGNPPGFARNFFAYVIAVDKDGKSLTKRPGVFMNATQSPFKANMEAEIYGSLDGPADLANFEKFVFISKDDYDKMK